jgi:hypothetical protein
MLYLDSNVAAPPHTAWFTEARFGLFVHFGLYSMAARHEWVMTREKMCAEEYEHYAEVFDPDLFDPASMSGAVLAYMTSAGDFRCPIDPDSPVQPVNDEDLLQLRRHAQGLADASA